jgi:hypothetical protein
MVSNNELKGSPSFTMMTAVNNCDAGNNFEDEDDEDDEEEEGEGEDDDEDDDDVTTFV